MPLLPLVAALLERLPVSDDNVIHFNPWRDFNDAGAPPPPPEIDPDPAQIATFLEVVFGHCEGRIPVRSFIDKGQGVGGKPHNIWIEADTSAPEKLVTFAGWAARECAAVYVVPGTVAEAGQARAVDVLQMQAVVVDLDAGHIEAKLAHLVRHVGEPSLLVASGGRTPEGADKLHVWWKLTEPAHGEGLALLCRVRAAMAACVGGDGHFGSAHQPIRVAGSVYHKGGLRRLVSIRAHNARVEWDLEELAERVEAMPSLGGLDVATGAARLVSRPAIGAVLSTPVHEGGQDGWTRFQGGSAAIGHYVRLVHEGRLAPEEGWEGICQYNAAMLRPAWPLERLKAEADRLWRLHVARHGPALERLSGGGPSSLAVHKLGALLDDQSPMPEDLIAPRVLTPGGLLVVGGAPKVGKSDFLINLLVHAAAGAAFLCFRPVRALRVFYLQAEIQYHYLRERLQGLALDPALLDVARDRLVATPKLRLLLDAPGVDAVAEAILRAFDGAPPDIICIDPLRNLFDGGPGGEGENNNDAMLFFLQHRLEALRERVAPEAGLIVAHHTRKLAKKQIAEDPFLALSGASALRGFYTSGMVMYRPDEERSERVLHIELRNGPGLEPMTIDKQVGRWIEIDRRDERLVHRELGARLDAERVRKHDVILGVLLDEALEGRLYTINQFAEAFENRGGLGGKDTIRDRLNVLATKGFIKFLRDGAPYGVGPSRSRFGFLCVEGMAMPGDGDAVDPETGQVMPATIAVLPTHYKSSQSGALLEVENPHVWVYPKGEAP